MWLGHPAQASHERLAHDLLIPQEQDQDDPATHGRDVHATSLL